MRDGLEDMAVYAYASRKFSNSSASFSAVRSFTRSTSGLGPGPRGPFLLPLTPTTPSSPYMRISLFMPGVLTEGGPRGREEERACRLLGGGALPSLRGSRSALSDWMTASSRDDMASYRCRSFEQSFEVLRLDWAVCDGMRLALSRGSDYLDDLTQRDNTTAFRFPWRDATSDRSIN